MAEQTSHCPYLGLKQNRAIRFASPTPEHRCYVSGEPLDIPVDQASYCLSPNHVHCPLYMGLSLPTMTDSVFTPTDQVSTTSTAELRGWFATLSKRDRVIYGSMLGVLLLIIGIYVFAALNTIVATEPSGAAGRTTITVTSPPVQTVHPSVVQTEPPTIAPSPTSLPTVQPTVAATDIPATPSMIILPQSVATALPDSADTQTVTLYFGDTTGSLYVPVERQVKVTNNDIEAVAVRELIAGPRNSELKSLLVPDLKLINLTITNGTATLNFDRSPTRQGDLGGYYAIVLTLTEFQPKVQRVQFQVNGQPNGVVIAGPVTRPAINPINSDLPYDINVISPLPLYFPSTDGKYDVRLMRLIPRTQQVAEATVRALLEGPGDYDYAVQRVIPQGTQLIGIQIDNQGIITLNFNQAFATAPDRSAAVRTIVASLTTLPVGNDNKKVAGVRFLVEGHPLADQWGDSYKNPFQRTPINPNF